MARPWELELLREIDDIALGIWRKKPTERTPANEADMSDSKGVVALMRGIGTRKET